MPKIIIYFFWSSHYTFYLFIFSSPPLEFNPSYLSPNPRANLLTMLLRADAQFTIGFMFLKPYESIIIKFIQENIGDIGHYSRSKFEVFFFPLFLLSK